MHWSIYQTVGKRPLFTYQKEVQLADTNYYVNVPCLKKIMTMTSMLILVILQLLTTQEKNIISQN